MQIPPLHKHLWQVTRRDLRELHWNILCHFVAHTTVQTQQGKLTVKLGHNEPIGKALFVDRSFELDLMQDALRHLRQRELIPSQGVGTLLDVGANNGVISIGALCHKEFASAVCVEPEPDNYALLCKNIAQNNLSECVRSYSYVVAERRMNVDFELSDLNFGDHRVRVSDRSGEERERYHESSRQVIQREARTIDEIVEALPIEMQRSIALVWIDIQGFEGRAFQGGVQLFSRGIPVVSELWPYGIMRSGMSVQEYVTTVKQFWKGVWILRRDRFVRYPVEQISLLFDELGDEGGADSVIFTNE